MSKQYYWTVAASAVKSSGEKDGKFTVIHDDSAGFPTSGAVANGGAPSSEFAVLIASGWDFRNHGDGYMYDRAGNKLNAPENLDPLPARFVGPDPLGMLQQWQQDHPYYRNQVYVDGQGEANKVGLPGEPSLPPVLFMSTVDGWYLRTDAGITLPPAPVVQPLPVPKDRDTMTILTGWPKAPLQLATRGLSSQEVQAVFEVPADHPVTKDANGLGKWDVAQILGNYRLGYKFVRNGKAEIDWSPDASTTIHLTLACGGSVPCDIRLQPGDKGIFSFRNADGDTGDDFFQFTPPK